MMDISVVSRVPALYAASRTVAHALSLALPATVRNVYIAHARRRLRARTSAHYRSDTRRVSGYNLPNQSKVLYLVTL